MESELTAVAAVVELEVFAGTLDVFGALAGLVAITEPLFCDALEPEAGCAVWEEESEDKTAAKAAAEI